MNIVYGDSLMAVSDDSFRYCGDERYPGAARDLSDSIAALDAARCDILIAAHPDSTNLWSMIDEHGHGNRAQLIDSSSCKRYAAAAKVRFDRRLAGERTASEYGGTMNKTAGRLLIAVFCVLTLTRCSSAPSRPETARKPVLLAIFAHPDDETTVGPVLAKYAADGVQVYLATATDGRLGVSHHAGIPAGDALAEVRAKELQCAAEKLGIQPPIRFGLYDQMRMAEGLAVYGAQISELRDRVKKLFEELQPDAVITWGPSGWTGHPDHRMVSSVVTEVFQSQSWVRPAQLYYPAVPTGRVPASNPIPTATVDERFLSVQIKVSPQDYDKARESWHCHRSQYTPEQIEQLRQALVAAEAGTVHFQPAIPVGRGRTDRLL